MLAGGVTGEVGARVAQVVTERLGAQVSLSRAPAAAAWGKSPDGAQRDAGALLESLLAGAGETRLLLTDADLCTPVLQYVFGAARRGATVAVVSLARLAAPAADPRGPALLAERAGKEALHELGHGFGLTHCREPHCLMRLAHTVQQVDERGNDFCSACRDHLNEVFSAGPTQPGGSRS